MGFLSDIKSRIMIYDGSKGYMLQEVGLPAGHSPEEFNLSRPEVVLDIHRQYIDAGCDVIQTNTFTGNRVLMERHGLGEAVYEANRAGAELAVEAAGGKVYAAASIGPTGLLFEPFGELTYEKAYDVFCEQVQAVLDGGVDLINLETFTDISEIRAAFQAVKDLTDKPVVCSMAFEENMHTLMGTDALTCGRILLRAGADLIGTNCSFGPAHMEGVIREMAKTGEFLSLKPNAGLPKVVEGNTVYEQCASDFASDVKKLMKYGVRLVGGCCGTTPAYIEEIRKDIEIQPYTGTVDDRIFLCSTSKGVHAFGDYTIGKVRFDESDDPGGISDEILDAAYDDFDVIELEYIGSDEGFLEQVLRTNSSGIRQPVILSGANDAAIESALRTYPGIAGIRKALSNQYGAVVL